MKKIQIHPTAHISEKAEIDYGTKIWHLAHIRENAKIGKNCIIGKNVYIDSNVIVGDNVKVQNNVSVYQGVIIESGVFIGPHVCFTNDKVPRAINPNGMLKEDNDWRLSKTVVKEGASIGANSTILPVDIGKFALIGAGSVVTNNIPDYGLAYGNPAKLLGFVCFCGNKLTDIGEKDNYMIMECPECRSRIEVKKGDYEELDKNLI